MAETTKTKLGDVRTALYLHAGGVPLKAAAEAVGYSYDYLRGVASSDEAKRFIEENEEQARRDVAAMTFRRWSEALVPSEVELLEAVG